jgi:excisionase family DNA binding protein
VARAKTGSRSTRQGAPALREQARRLDAAVKATPKDQPMPPLDELGLDDVAIPRQALAAAAEALRCEANGEQPEIVVLRETLSAQQAADLVGVSRPHLNLLLDRERVPYTTTVGGHRRIKRADIEDYRDRRTRAHDAMHDAMAAAEDLAPDEV